MRKSTITAQQDAAGGYEIEIFDCPEPQRVIVCAHGNGVRRWDGEKFYYAVAERYSDSAVILVDQNQPEGDACRLNSLEIMAARLAEAINAGAAKYPGVPIVIIAHSMGCGIVTKIDLANVNSVFFVAPATGSPAKTLLKRYGPDIVNGKTVTSSDGLTKIITKEYYDSVIGINWEAEYTRLVARYSPVYAYEAGDDEVLDESRFVHRTIPFTSYEILEGAKHNFSGQAINELFQKMDTVLSKQDSL